MSSSGGPVPPPAAARQTRAAKIILSRRRRTNKRGDCQEVMTLLVFRPRAPCHNKKARGCERRRLGKMQGRGRALVLGRVVDLFSLRFMLQQCTQTPLTLPTPPPPPTCPEMPVFEISFIESETLRRESGGGGGVPVRPGESTLHG